MGINFQVYRAAVNIAKGVRQFQKADKAIGKENVDSAARHLDKGMNDFAAALSHLEQAEEDAYVKAAKEIEQGNEQLKKALDAYADGNDKGAESHYEKALEKYDAALELLDA